MKRQYHRLKDTKQFNQRYDYGSVMHYPPEDYRSGMYVFRGPVLLLREPRPGWLGNHFGVFCSITFN